MKIKKDMPDDSFLLRMFEMCDTYLCESLQTGWTYSEALKFLKENWNNPDFDLDYMQILKDEQEEL